MCDWVLTLNDGKSQIKQEKGSNKDHRHEEEEGPRGVGFHVHDHDVWPSFQTDALENIEECPENVVEIRYIIVGI